MIINGLDLFTFGAVLFAFNCWRFSAIPTVAIGTSRYLGLT